MAPNVQRFCGLVAKARLLSGAELETVYRTWRAQAPNERDNLRSFIKFLVAKTSLTAQQVEKVLTESTPGTTEAPVTPTTINEDEYEVVLVRGRDPKRGLDRRDLLMLLGGAAGAAAAILIPALIASQINKPSAMPTPTTTDPPADNSEK